MKWVVVGIDNLDKFAKLYGLGEKTGINLRGEAIRVTLLALNISVKYLTKTGT